MTIKPGTTIAIVIFVVVGILHLYRAIAGTPVMVGDWAFPVWGSYLGTIVPLAVAFLLWRESR